LATPYTASQPFSARMAGIARGLFAPI